MQIELSDTEMALLRSCLDTAAARRRYFTDTSGNARCEKVTPDGKGRDYTSWAGVKFTVVHPHPGALSQEQLQRRYAAVEQFLLMMGCDRRGSKFLFDRFDTEFYILFDMAEDLDNPQAYGLADVYLLRVGHTPMPGEHALRVLTNVDTDRITVFLAGLGLKRFPPTTRLFLQSSVAVLLGIEAQGGAKRVPHVNPPVNPQEYGSGDRILLDGRSGVIVKRNGWIATIQLDNESGADEADLNDLISEGRIQKEPVGG